MKEKLRKVSEGEMYEAESQNKELTQLSSMARIGRVFLKNIDQLKQQTKKGTAPQANFQLNASTSPTNEAVNNVTSKPGTGPFPAPIQQSNTPSKPEMTAKATSAPTKSGAEGSPHSVSSTKGVPRTVLKSNTYTPSASRSKTLQNQQKDMSQVLQSARNKFPKKVLLHGVLFEGGPLGASFVLEQIRGRKPAAKVAFDYDGYGASVKRQTNNFLK